MHIFDTVRTIKNMSQKKSPIRNKTRKRPLRIAEEWVNDGATIELLIVWLCVRVSIYVYAFCV